MIDISLLPFNGKMASAKPFHLSIGENPVKVSWSEEGETAKSKRDVNLHISLDDNESGVHFDLRIEYRGLLIEKLSVPAFGSVSFSVLLRGFVNSSIFNFVVVAREITPHSRLNSPTDGTGQLTINALEFEEFSPKEVLSERLIPLCEDLSKSLGLAGNYMNGERAERIINEVDRSISEGRGYSIIRLGDGEGRILAEEGFFSENDLIHQTLNYHFGKVSNAQLKATYGPSWIQESIRDLRRILAPAILNADQIGVPVAEYFSSAREKVVSGHFGYVAALLFGVSSRPNRSIQSILGTNAFQLVATDGNFFPRLLRIPRNVSIVGPWNLLPALEKAIPEMNYGDFIEVQQHFSFREEPGWGQFPIHWKITNAKIESMGDLRGRLFLVAAGLLGKHYCNKIKLQGGVALDIGSVLDSWAKRGRTEAISNSSRISIEKFSKSPDNT